MLILGIFEKISFGMVSGIFMMVAKVYDLLLKIVHQTYKMDASYFEQFATTVYVLAGVFMLFRTVISLIQMLINPDQINDKQVGAGKIVTRIITCIIMLMVFAPNGILFGQSGLFAEVEDALLAEQDGLVTRMVNLSEPDKSDEITTKSNNGFLIENVEAAKTQKLTCYYMDKQAQVWTNPASTSETGNRQYYYTMGYPIKIEFYSDSTTGKTGHINCNNGKCKYSYTVLSTQRVNGDDKLGYYGSVDKAITKGNFFNTDKFPSTCPKAFKEVDGHLAAQKNYIEHGNSLADCGKNSGVTKKIKTQCWNSDKNKMEDCERTGLECKNIGIQGGYSSYKALKKAVSDLQLSLTGASASVASPSKFVQENTNTSKNDDTAPLKRYLDGVEPAAVVFAQGTASSLQECTAEKKEECAEAQHGKNNNGTDGMFKDTSSNSTIIKLMSSDDLDIGFIISILTGIALMFYLLYLCIEVLVRKLKLYFLEMIAPLPIVCYINPKDKIFNQWIKMYLTTYVDLFIKLISIGIAVNLLAATFKDFWSTGGWLIKFFYIVAILVFAKLVPTMISKIFGLDSMGGSFKDISGMAKAAVGFGAGAVVGATAGAISGRGLGRFSGFAKGAMMGAGSGAKGKPLGGANAISAKNARINDAKANGLGFWQRTAASMAGAVGYSPKARMDNKIKGKVDKQKMLDDFRKHKDNVEEAAEKFSPIADLKQQMLQGNITKDEFKAARKQYIAAAERGDKTFSIDIKRKDENGNDISVFRTGTVDIKDSDRDKVVTKIEEMKTAYNSSGALQKEIATANGGVAVNIDSYAAFENAEGIATKQRNAYNKEIIAVQSSDKYGKAQAFDDYSKSNK